MSDLIQVPMPQAAYRQWFFSGTGKSYTLDELDALIAPTYCVYTAQINRCISGLVHYAALHTLASQDDNVSRLRELILEMASFWGLDGGTDKGVFERLEHQYGGTFDQAVSAAQRSGNVPDLTGQEKTDILNGLEVHAQEMSNNDEAILRIEECCTLMRQMREEWQMDIFLPMQTTLTMGGLSL